MEFRLRRSFDLALIVVFAAALGLPAARFVLGRAQPKMLAGENRPPAAPPPPPLARKDIARFPARFESYFQDRLPARELLLSEQARFKVDWLDTSSSDKVIVGRDGWLFMNEEKSENPGREVSQEEQCRLWAAEFRRRRDWLAGRGIEYIVVLTPEKHSIYPEYLPEIHRHAHGPSAAEMLAEALRSDAEMNVVVLRKVLWSGKGSSPRYFHTDTHWNDEGAYLGYCAVVQHLSLRWPEMESVERDQFEHYRVTSFTGDLIRILHLPGEHAEPFEAWQLRKPKAVRLPEELPLDSRLHFPKHLQPQIWGRQDTRLPRGLLFHDSFAAQLWLPLLAEHFDRLGYAATAGFDPQTVEAIHPQVVIQEIVERKINWHTPEPLCR
jgi:alginate O-acetyltransferase complex protein AlgJ